MMRHTFMKATLFISAICVIFLITPHPTADAGFFDRIKDIYNTPEKISELESQYLEAKAALSEQQQQLEESLQAAEQYAIKQQELLEQNEQFRMQNEQLIAQNASMQAEMEQMKQDRHSFITKLIYSGVTVFALIIAYILSIRIWRYVIWRKQRLASRNELSG